MITLLLVDDQVTVRKGLRMRLALEPDMTVLGEAGDATSALALIPALAPDVVVMDVELPDGNGIDVTAALQTAAPHSAVVVLSLHDDGATRTRALAAGATAFVAKHQPDGVLLDAIRQASHGSQRQEAPMCTR